MRAFLALPLGLLLAAPAGAAELSYETCVDRATVDPGPTAARARAWYGETGSVAALHCEAIALEALGATLTAAERMRDVANAPNVPPAVRTESLREAARLWQEAGVIDAAEGALDAALGIQREAATLVDRAALRARKEVWPGAKADLDEALRLQPGDAEIFTLRAAARRQLGDARGARADALLAAERAPTLAAAWFELGMAEAVLGLDQAARRSWLKAIEAEPGAVAATLARGALQDMDGR